MAFQMQMDEDSMVAYVRTPSLLPEQWNYSDTHAGAAAGAATGTIAEAAVDAPTHHQTMDYFNQYGALTQRDSSPSVGIDNSGWFWQQHCVEGTTSAPAEGAQKMQVLLCDILQGKGNSTERWGERFSGVDAGTEVAAAAATWENPNAQCTEEQVRATVSSVPGRMKVDLEASIASPTVSIGSLGHPISCASACKYVMKKRGCKDGALCDHCHLCAWTRRPSRVAMAANYMSSRCYRSPTHPMCC